MSLKCLQNIKFDICWKRQILNSFGKINIFQNFFCQLKIQRPILIKSIKLPLPLCKEVLIVAHPIPPRSGKM